MLPWKICYRDTRTHCLGNKEHLASDQGPSYLRLINALLVKLPDSRWTFIINDHRVHFNFRLLKPQECKTLFPGNIQTVMSFCSSSNTTAKYPPNTKEEQTTKHMLCFKTCRAGYASQCMVPFKMSCFGLIQLQ